MHFCHSNLPPFSLIFHSRAFPINFTINCPLHGLIMEAGHFLSPDSEAMRTGTETETLDLKRNLKLYRKMKEKLEKEEERESRAYESPA